MSRAHQCDARVCASRLDAPGTDCRQGRPGGPRFWAVLVWGTVVALVLAPAAGAQMPDPPQVGSAELGARLVAVDHTVAAAGFEEALTDLRELQGRHPGEPEVLWRLSRVKVDVGLERATNSAEQRELYRTALDAAYQAVELSPDHPEAHLAVAMAAGQAGLAAGITERVEHSRAVRRHVDRVIELNDEHDVAYHVRARWHFEVATLGFVARAALRLVYGGMPDASLQEAEEDFQRAIRLHDRIIHRLQMARVLVEQNRGDEASRHLERALQMPHHAPRDPQYQQEARDLLDEVRAAYGSGSQR